MKKLSIFAVGLVALLSATSCSSDDALDAPGNGSEANVSFTLELPKGLASRAFGDGTTATSLSYAVYDVTGASDPSAWTEVYKKDDDGTFVGLKTTKSFKLVNGRTYTFVFWADNGSTSPYTFNGKGVSVDYASLTNNEETRDAFFAVKSDIKVTGSFTEDVELYRPFAQLNLGTDDLAEEVVTKVYGENCANLNTKLTVKVPNALNLIDGSVAEQGEWTEVTFGPNGIPSGETFPVEHPEKPTKAYGYLSMNYLLMPATKSVIDVKYEFYNGTSTEAAKTINLTNVPVQRNYRTNIFGSLLTSEGIFNIEILPDFDTPDYSYDEEGYRISTSLEEAQKFLADGESAVAIDGKLVVGSRSRADIGAVPFLLNKKVASQALKIIGKSASPIKVSYADGDGVANPQFKLVVTGDISGVELNLPSAAVKVEGRSETNEKVNVANITITDAASATVSGDVAVEELVKGENIPDVEFEGAVEITVTTAEDFLNALSAQDVEKINMTADINLTTATIEQLTVNSAKTIEISESKTLTLGDTNYITGNADLTLLGKGTITNEYEGSNPEEYTSKELVVMMHGNLVAHDLTFINDMNHHWHGNTHNSNAISYWNDVNVTMENVTVKSGEFTLCGMGRGVASGIVILTNSYFESNSSNKDNGKHWAYAMRIFGSKSVLTNCEVKGIQGGVSAEETEMTIKSGKYYTVNSDGNKDAFYAVYVTNAGKVIIEDGEFSGANDWSGGLAEGSSCVVSGDNDVNLPVGSVVVKGGKFSGKPYNHETNEVYAPQSPMVWRAIEGDATFKWQPKTPSGN